MTEVFWFAGLWCKLTGHNWSKWYMPPGPIWKSQPAQDAYCKLCFKVYNPDYKAPVKPFTAILGGWPLIIGSMVTEQGREAHNKKYNPHELEGSVKENLRV